MEVDNVEVVLVPVVFTRFHKHNAVFLADPKNANSINLHLMKRSKMS